MRKFKKIIFNIIGIIFLILGSVGIFFPVLPTFPFYLLAAMLFSISNVKLHNYIVSTKFYKQNIELFVKEKKLTKVTKIKFLSSITIFMGIGIFFMMIKKLYIPSLIVGIVYIFHVVYFGFIVKTKNNQNDQN